MKNTVKKVVSFLSVVTMAFSFSAAAYADECDGFEYDVFNGGANISRYTGYKDTVVIPERLSNGVRVAGLTLPYIIGDDDPFPVVNLEIKNGSIAYGTMSSATRLQNLTIKSFEPYSAFVPFAAFENCTALKTVGLPDSTQKIEGAAFRNCSSLKTVSSPSSLKIVEENAFADCLALEYFGFSKNLEKIGNRAFSNCSALKTVSFDGKVKSIGDGAFENCRSLKNLEIPFGAESLGKDAFNGCSALEEVKIGYGPTALGGGTFANCPSLETVVIPYSVKTIARDTFENDDGISLIKGIKGTAAEDFAKYKGITFEALPRIWGDVNWDEKVNVGDALAILQFSVKKISLDDYVEKSADVDGKDGISVSDALVVLQYSVGKIKTLPLK